MASKEKRFAIVFLVLSTLLGLFGLGVVLPLKADLIGRGVSSEVSNLIAGAIFFGVGSFFVYWASLKILQAPLQSHFSQGGQTAMSCLIFAAALLVAEIPLIEFILRQFGQESSWWGGLVKKSYLLPLLIVIFGALWRNQQKKHLANPDMEEK